MTYDNEKSQGYASSPIYKNCNAGLNAAADNFKHGNCGVSYNIGYSSNKTNYNTGNNNYKI